jgi:hypothetical protein
MRKKKRDRISRVTWDIIEGRVDSRKTSEDVWMMKTCKIKYIHENIQKTKGKQPSETGVRSTRDTRGTGDTGKRTEGRQG